MKLGIYTVAAFSALFMASCDGPSGGMDKVTSLNNETDSVSYAVGMLEGRNFRNSGMEEFNEYAFVAGMQHVMDSSEAQLLTMEESDKIVNDYFQKMRQKMNEKQFGDNIKAEKDFLAANGQREGVVTTGSGLQYEILEEGTGATPGPTSQVKVHYRGTLLNGDQFDSSYDRGEPAEFRVNGVIPGWTEALMMMKEGAKWKLYIPSELAYGERGAGGQIKPYSMLIFDVELLEVKE